MLSAISHLVRDQRVIGFVAFVGHYLELFNQADDADPFTLI